MMINGAEKKKDRRPAIVTGDLIRGDRRVLHVLLLEKEGSPRFFFSVLFSFFHLLLIYFLLLCL